MVADKKQAIFLDAVVLESCNLMCSYCREDMIFDQDELNKVVQTVSHSMVIREIADYDIFKTSGYGEITLSKDLPEVIELIKDKRLLVITNGTTLRKDLIQLLLTHPDPALCVSLDGHSPEMNVHRHLSQSQIDRLFESISNVQKQRIPIEINSVITRQSISSFRLYLDFLIEGEYSLMVFPFPVRRFPFMKEDNYLPSPKQVDIFEKEIVENYDQYERVLPPLPYMNRLITFMKKGKRLFNCTLPSFVIGLNGNVDVLGCPCGPEETLGNLLSNDLEDVKQNLLSSKKGRWAECENCFNHYEAISMFLTGEIPIEDMARIPSISKTAILDHLEKIKEDYRNG